MSLGRRGEWRYPTLNTLSSVGDNFRRERTSIEQMPRRSLRIIELTGINDLPLVLDRDLWGMGRPYESCNAGLLGGVMAIGTRNIP